MDGMVKKIFVFVILVLTFGLALATIIAPKKDYSENENRYLEKFPEPSLENITDATFMKDTETFVSDHFILRDIFMTIKTGYERATGRNRVNNIYLCKDGYYMEEYSPLKNSERIVSAIKRLSENSQSKNIRILLVPTAVQILKDRLPSTAKNADQISDMKKIEAALEKSFDSINAEGRSAVFVDVADALKKAGGEQIFYRLDHHWTTLGAYTAYREIARSFGFTPLEKNEFTVKTVSTDFKGSFYSKVNDLFAKPDSIEVFESDRLSLSVKYPDKKIETDRLTADEYLEKKDKYSYFLNNQNSFVEVHNSNAESDRSLAVVKDSYANCIIPFLAEHFSTVYVFDTRFYRESVTDFINENSVSDTLFLYNMYTIDTDTGINGIR